MAVGSFQGFNTPGRALTGGGGGPSSKDRSYDPYQFGPLQVGESPQATASAFSGSPAPVGLTESPDTAARAGSVHIAPFSASPYNLAALSGPTAIANALFGPQSQLIADQLARQQDQLGMVGIGVQHDIGTLQRDNKLANQLLGLDRQANALEGGLARGQLSNLDKLRDILGVRRGLAGEVKGLDTEKAKDLASRSQWDLRSDLTQRGAFNTIANERGTGRINRDLGYQLRGIDQQYRNTLLGLDEQGISYDNQALALNNKLANVGLDAKRLDITDQQLQNALADGIYNAGLGGMVNVNQILDAMSGTNAQQAALATQILSAIMGYANLPPDVLAQIQQALGVGPGSGQASGQTSAGQSTGSSGSSRTGGNYG